jgi:hypothetical protein
LSTGQIKTGAPCRSELFFFLSLFLVFAGDHGEKRLLSRRSKGSCRRR